MPDATRRPPRFSLLNLLLVSTAVALLCALLVTARHTRHEARQLRNELAWANSDITRLRNELGYFAIEGPSLVHFRNERRWNSGDDLLRLHLPFERRYRLCVQVHDYQREPGVPEYEGPQDLENGARPNLRASLELTPGFSTVRLRYERDKFGKLQLKLSFHGESLSATDKTSVSFGVIELDIPEREPGENRKIVEGDRRGSRNLRTSSADEPRIVLLKVAADAGGYVNAPEDHGLMVWLEPIEGEPTTRRWWEADPEADGEPVFSDAFNANGLP